MSVPSLVRFMEEGAWLNVYESTAKKTGLEGDELRQAVGNRLREFKRQRLKIDQMFRFELDTHYATLNLGGLGPRRYGPCCVVFDLKHWAPYHTCFAGDSIRACFDSAGESVLDDDAVLAKFGIGEDADRLAVIRHCKMLERQWFCLDPCEVRHIVEDEDSLLELHLHGPVTRSQVQEVRIARENFHSWRSLLERYDPSSKSWEFDLVPSLHRMKELVEEYDVPLVLADGR
jgi:hypothetical protein